MRTIDEAITHARDVAEYKRKCNENSDCIDIECEHCAKEHEQLAEWLKELKAYRTLDKTNFSDGYNRGVDDLSELLKGNLVRKYANSSLSQQYVAMQVTDWCNEMTEQLKERESE